MQGRCRSRAASLRRLHRFIPVWPVSGVSRRRDSGEPPRTRARTLAIRPRALPARLLRPAQRDVHRAYRHRPLHLFGGIGLLMGAVGFTSCSLTMLWFWGHGIADVRCSSLACSSKSSASSSSRSDCSRSSLRRSTRSGWTNANASPGWSRTSCASPRCESSTSGPDERDYPRNAQVISCPPARPVSTSPSTTLPCGRASDNSSPFQRDRAVLYCYGSPVLRHDSCGSPPLRSTSCSSAIRGTSTWPAPAGLPAAAQSCSTRCYRCTTRWCSIGAASASGRPLRGSSGP